MARLRTLPQVPPILLRQSEASIMLGVGLSTVERLIKEGQLPIRRIGSLVRIHIDDVQRYADELPPG